MKKDFLHIRYVQWVNGTETEMVCLYSPRITKSEALGIAVTGRQSDYVVCMMASQYDTVINPSVKFSEKVPLRVGQSIWLFDDLFDYFPIHLYIEEIRLDENGKYSAITADYKDNEGTVTDNIVLSREDLRGVYLNRELTGGSVFSAL